MEKLCDPDLRYYIDLELIASYDPELLIPSEQERDVAKEFNTLVTNLEDNHNIVVGNDHSWHAPDDEAYLAASHAQTEAKPHFDPTLN